MIELKSSGSGARIPGQSAPASLKPDAEEAAAAEQERHSGAVCPGLIEAREAGVAVGNFNDAFRGSLPRPH